MQRIKIAITMKRFDNKQEVIAQEVTEHISETPEKGYVINKGIPSFVGPAGK